MKAAQGQIAGLTMRGSHQTPAEVLRQLRNRRSWLIRASTPLRLLASLKSEAEKVAVFRAFSTRAKTIRTALVFIVVQTLLKITSTANPLRE